MCLTISVHGYCLFVFLVSCNDLSLLPVVSAFQVQYRGNKCSPACSVRPGALSCAAANENTDAERFGLLRGIDPQVADHYSESIDMSPQGLAWLKTPGLLWEAAENDANEQHVTTQDYIDTIGRNLQSYLRSGVLSGHNAVSLQLGHVIGWEGELALLIGGMGEDRSLILRSLRDRYIHGDAKDKKRMVLYLNGRKYPNQLAEGMFAELILLGWATRFNRQLSEDHRSGLLNSILSIIKYNSYAVIAKAKMYLEQEIRATRKERNSLIRVAKKAHQYMTGGLSIDLQRPDFNDVCDGFIDYAKQQGLYPVLIIDEAEMPEIQDYLVGLNSGAKAYKMTVVLATSEYHYPVLLANDKAFYLSQWTSIMVTGDMSPKETWNLLVSAEQDAFTPAACATPKTVGLGHRLVRLVRRLLHTEVMVEGSNEIVTLDQGTNKVIGMGCHLAELCLGAYGGNIALINNAIMALACWKEQFSAFENFADHHEQRTINCLKIQGTRALLEKLAERGFATVIFYDEAVTTIQEKHLGGYVTRFRTYIEHVSKDIVWTDDTRETYCIIPPYHSVRLLISMELATQPELAPANT